MQDIILFGAEAAGAAAQASKQPWFVAALAAISTLVVGLVAGAVALVQFVHATRTQARAPFVALQLKTYEQIIEHASALPTSTGAGDYGDNLGKLRNLLHGPLLAFGAEKLVEALSSHIAKMPPSYDEFVPKKAEAQSHANALVSAIRAEIVASWSVRSDLEAVVTNEISPFLKLAQRSANDGVQKFVSRVREKLDQANKVAEQAQQRK